MRQLILPDSFDPSMPVLLDRKDTHYLKNVLRCRKGSRFAAAGRDGKLWDAVLEGFENRNAVIRVYEKEAESDTGRESGKLPEIWLFQALLKGKKMDLVVRQAAEAGVSAIVPVLSEFVVPRPGGQAGDAKGGRWMKICREALQQSGSGICTEILPLIKLRDIPVSIESSGYGNKGKEEKKQTSLFFHEKDIENKSLHQYLFPVTDRINILIGPEGGFSPDETVFLMENRFLPVYLGKNVLRAETAALFSVAAVKTLLLEKEKWTLA